MPPKFRQQILKGFKAIIAGIGECKGLIPGQLINAHDFHFAQARCIADLPGPHAGATPITNRLPLFTGPNQFDKMFLQ